MKRPLGPPRHKTVTVRLTIEEWCALAKEAHDLGIGVTELAKQRLTAKRS